MCARRGGRARGAGRRASARRRPRARAAAQDRTEGTATCACQRFFTGGGRGAGGGTGGEGAPARRRGGAAAAAWRRRQRADGGPPGRDDCVGFFQLLKGQSCRSAARRAWGVESVAVLLPPRRDAPPKRATPTPSESVSLAERRASLPASHAGPRIACCALSPSQLRLRRSSPHSTHAGSLPAGSFNERARAPFRQPASRAPRPAVGGPAAGAHR